MNRTPCLSVDAIEKHLRVSLSKYKLPAEITVLDDLPKNPIGKIDKPRLRHRVAQTP
jgi:long-chain acyl-CoA synthetase